jgi:hypothetical protein
MYLQTDHTCSIADLYARRDSIGLSRSECKQPPHRRSLFEWGRGQQAYYLNNLTLNLSSPPVVYIWEPSDGFGRGAVLDGRQRLKAFFSYLDGNYRRREIAPSEWGGKDFIHLVAKDPSLAQILQQTPIQVVTIQAPSYWEAAIATYPQICGHTRETVSNEQQMLMHHLDAGDNIFGSRDFCDRKVASLKKTLDGIEFRYAGLRVPVPQLSPRNYSKIVEWQIRVTEFVARHHHRGVIPC